MLKGLLLGMRHWDSGFLVHFHDGSRNAKDSLDSAVLSVCHLQSTTVFHLTDERNPLSRLMYHNSSYMGADLMTSC